MAATSRSDRRVQVLRMLLAVAARLGAIGWAVVLGLAAAQAHPMPDSKVGVAIQHDRIVLHLELPADRLAMAMIEAGAVPDPGPGFTTYPRLPRAAIARYVQANVAVRSAGGALPVAVEHIARPGPRERNLTVDLAAPLPPADAARPIGLDYGVVIRHVVPDVALVALVQDWRAGVTPDHPVLLGSLSGDPRRLVIAPRRPDLAAAAGAMLRLGVWHILEGADHLAFLLTLLLTVGLRAEGTVWTDPRDPRQLTRDTLWRVSAFTLGHTLALMAASLGWLPPAGRAVEVLIAVSVAVSAAHAFTPIFPRREGVVAALFGLVHGMAFASVIRSLHLSVEDTVLATLAFNLGIELAQIAIVVLTLPVLIWLRRTRWDRPARQALAAVAFLCAVCWVVARLTG